METPGLGSGLQMSVVALCVCVWGGRLGEGWDEKQGGYEKGGGTDLTGEVALELMMSPS